MTEVVSFGNAPAELRLHDVGRGAAIQHARDIAYADGLSLDDPQIITQIGVSCRTCPRNDCADRAVPSLHKRLELDDNRRGLSACARAG